MPVGFPLLLPTGEQGAQVAHLIGTVLSPTHATPFHSLADDRLARRLDRAGADRPTLRLVGRVVHPMNMILEVAHHLAVDLAHPLAAIGRQRAQLPQDSLTALVLQ